MSSMPMLSGILGIGSSTRNQAYPTALGIETLAAGAQAAIGTYIVENVPILGIENKYSKSFLIGTVLQAVYATAILGYPLY
jgi:hypothetical protein